MNLGDHQVTNGFVLYKPVLTLRCFKSYEEALTQSDIMLDIMVNPWSGLINWYNTLRNALLDDRHELGGPAFPIFVNMIRIFD